MKLLKDPVANIRLQAILSLMKIYLECQDNKIETATKKAITLLAGDNDSDIKLVIQKATSVDKWKSIVEENSF